MFQQLSIEDCSQSYNGSTTLDKLTLDRGKLVPTESAFCAKFIVQPSLRNTATDDLPVVGDCKRTVSVCGDFEDYSLRRLPCYVFPSSAHECVGMLRQHLEWGEFSALQCSDDQNPL